MQEEDVSNDGRFNAFGWSGPYSVKYASAHKAAVGGGLCTPDRRSQANDLREYVSRPTPERCRNRNPDEVAKAKDEDSNTSKSYHISKLGVEFLDVIREHRREGKRTESLGKRNGAGGSDALLRCQPPETSL